MFFATPYKLAHMNPVQLSVENHQLERVYTYKYLGVWLDASMTWQKHIEQTSKKIGQRLALLRRLRPYLTTNSAKLLANALVLPFFDYCSPVWTNCSQTVKDIIIKQHKRMARLVLKVHPQTPTNYVLSELKWTTIEKRWEFHKCKMIYSALHGEAPMYLKDLFVRSDTVHRHSTRNASNYGVCVPRVRSQAGKKSFSHEGAILWNKLPNHVKCAATMHTFACQYLTSNL